MATEQEADFHGGASTFAHPEEPDFAYTVANTALLIVGGPQHGGRAGDAGVVIFAMDPPQLVAIPWVEAEGRSAAIDGVNFGAYVLDVLDTFLLTMPQGGAVAAKFELVFWDAESRRYVRSSPTATAT